MKRIIIFAVILFFTGSSFGKLRSFIQDFNAAECSSGATKEIVSDANWIYSVIIDSNGTDTSYNLDLYEKIYDVNYIIQAFTCSSASEPQNLAVGISDISGNLFGGYPLSGPVSVKLSNAEGLDKCRVIIKAEVLHEFNDVNILAALTSLESNTIEGLNAIDANIVELIDVINGEPISEDPNNNPAIHAGNAIRDSIQPLE
jgi:hypothetical protein